jgi:hypothetical protein
MYSLELDVEEMAERGGNRYRNAVAAFRRIASSLGSVKPSTGGW